MLDQTVTAVLSGIWAHDCTCWLQQSSLQGKRLFNVLHLSLWFLPPELLVSTDTGFIGTVHLCHGACWCHWGHQSTNRPALCWCLYRMSAQESFPTPLSGLSNRGHAVKFIPTCLKIYGLTWALSLGMSPWVSQSEWKPNVSGFHVYPFHKHSTYAVCSCSPERVSSPGIWRIYTLRAHPIDSAVERTRDAGPPHNSFIKLSGRVSSKVRGVELELRQSMCSALQ